MTHTAHIPAKRWQVIEGETPPEWVGPLLWRTGAEKLFENTDFSQFEAGNGMFGDWLYQLPDGTIGTCTDEMAAKMFCEPYEEAARVAEGVRSYDDTLQKSVGARTTGERIARAIRNLKDATDG